MKSDELALITSLRVARHKILVGVRPLAPARDAFDITLSAVISSLPAGAAGTKAILRTLMFNEVISDASAEQTANTLRDIAKVIKKRHKQQCVLQTRSYVKVSFV